MRYRKFGKLNLSELGVGGWTIGSDMYGVVDLDTAYKIVKTAVDRGINYFDTADIYGRGRSEELLGTWLKGYDVYISTKVGYDFYSQKPLRRYDLGYLQFAIGQSKRRLGRTPDILYIHNAPAEEIEKASAYIGQLKEDNYVGVALGPEVEVLREGLTAIAAGYDALMFVFNLLEQEPGLEIIGRGADRLLAVRVPHASEVLTDRFRAEFPATDHRSLRKREWLISARRLVEKEIVPLARELGLTLGQYALKYVLSFPVTTVLLTVTSVEELEEYIEASDGRMLPRHHLEHIREFWVRENAGGGI
ncbi:MAG: aldo/keto reductase [Pyrobaculum sp.]